MCIRYTVYRNRLIIHTYSITIAISYIYINAGLILYYKMSNHTASLQKAIDILDEAIREDQDSNWEKAVELYNRALEFFIHHIKYEKNAKTRVMIYIRVKKYTDRAEQIKKMIDEWKKSKKIRKASANGDEVDNASLQKAITMGCYVQ